MPWYFIMDVVLCLLAIGIIIWSYPKLDRVWKKCCVITALIIMVLQIINENMSLHIFFAWTFSTEHNRLLGVDIFNTPIEEYLFWFAFAWLIPYFYAGLTATFRKQPKSNPVREGKANG